MIEDPAETEEFEAGKTKTDAFENTKPWRVGRKVGRTIYVRLGPEPSDADPIIGLMDSPEVALEACRAHNYTLRQAAGRREP